MRIETPRLLITDFTMDLCESVHRNSLDEDTRRFVPDEVFETLEEAQEVVAFLMQAAQGTEGPFVYPILCKADGCNIGYVQAVPQDDGCEIGYHIAKTYTGNGYASEAVSAFLPVIMDKLGVQEMLGVVLTENTASCRVLEKCGFRLVFEGNDLYQGQIRPICKYLYRR